MNNIDYRKVNSLFFFIGIAFTIIVELINSIVMHRSFGSFAGLMCISLVMVLLCFYRFNNGVIALLRGRFAKPKSTDLHFVDYDKVRNGDSIASSTAGSIVAYKLNTRDAYQIIKQDKTLLIKHVDIGSSFDDSTLLSPDEYGGAKNGMRDILIPFDSIDRVTYKISPENYYEPIIVIKSGKKSYYFIGFLAPFDDEEIVCFFQDIADVKVLDTSQERVKSRIENDKSKLFYNTLKLIACISIPNTVLAHLINSDEKSSHILTSIYMLVSVATLVALFLLPIIKPKKYGFFVDDTIKSERDKTDISLGPVVIGSFLVFGILEYETPINFTWYAILVGICSIAFIIASFSRNKLNTDNNRRMVGRVFVVMFFSVIIGASLVGGINYSVPVKSYSQTYHISDRHTYHSKNSESYYVTVNFDGKPKDIMVNEETYNSNDSTIKLERTRGILGVEYVAEYNE